MKFKQGEQDASSAVPSSQSCIFEYMAAAALTSTSSRTANENEGTNGPFDCLHVTHHIDRIPFVSKFAVQLLHFVHERGIALLTFQPGLAINPYAVSSKRAQAHVSLRIYQPLLLPPLSLLLVRHLDRRLDDESEWSPCPGHIVRP